MFTRVTRSGGRAYLQLVQSFRNEAGQPRQRVVGNLGRLDQLSDSDLDPLIGGLQRALGRKAAPVPSVPFESSKAFGELFALHTLWNELGVVQTAELVAATKMRAGLGETTWKSRRLVIAHDEDRAQHQHAARRATIADIQAAGERLAKRRDDAGAGKAQRGRQSDDRKA